MMNTVLKHPDIKDQKIQPEFGFLADTSCSIPFLLQAGRSQSARIWELKLLIEGPLPPHEDPVFEITNHCGELLDLAYAILRFVLGIYIKKASVYLSAKP